MGVYGGDAPSVPPPDPRLVAAQIKSMGIQDVAITQMLSNSAAMMPMQMEQMRFGLDSSKKAYEQSQEDRTWMLDRRGHLSGMQDTMLADAREFNTSDKREQLAGQAQADVTSAFDNVQQQQSRNLARTGVNPSAGRSLEMKNQVGIAQAATTAAASNKTREAARLEGYALTDRASNALAGYPAMSASATGAGANYGTMGLATANAGLAGMNSGLNSAASVAGQMGTNATGMFNAQANYQTSMANANQGEGIGAILGGVGGLAAGAAKLAPLFSDRRLKDNIVLVGRDEATGLGLYEFNYKIHPSARFRGVMADEVETFMPSAVIRDAGGYLAVDYSQIGIDMVEV